MGADAIFSMAATAADTIDLNLKERLMLARGGGSEGRGDKRGKQSAAIRVFNIEAYPWFDIRVDEHLEPIARRG